MDGGGFQSETLVIELITFESIDLKLSFLNYTKNIWHNMGRRYETLILIIKAKMISLGISQNNEE